MKVGSFYRDQMVSTIKNKTKDSGALFFVGFEGVSTVKISELRKTLKTKNTRMVVTKNKLFEKVTDADITSLLAGQTGVVYPNGDIVEAAKALYDFKKENDKFVVKGGVINQSVLKAEDVAALSKLPSRQVLIGMAVNAIAAPISKLACTLNQVIVKLPYALNAVIEKKEKQG